jgi:hypothetical protein
MTAPSLPITSPYTPAQTAKLRLFLQSVDTQSYVRLTARSTVAISYIDICSLDLRILLDSLELTDYERTCITQILYARKELGLI